MSHVHSAPAPVLAVVNGVPTTTTHDIARVYGKRHDHVLRIVRQRMAECPSDWCLPNFGEASVELPQPNGGTVSYPVIRLSKKGFHFVVGKFTGAKAVQHQIAFADEFERMEAELARRAQALLAVPVAAPALPKPAIRRREDLSFARHDKNGHWRNWSVEPRCRQWEDGIERGEAFFREVAELAAHDEDEAYDALRFVFGRGWESATNGTSEWSTSHPGEETGFARALARAALDGLRARRAGAESFDPDHQPKPGRPRKDGFKHGAQGPSALVH
ncbi:Rha family transcriptional regulator [Malikia sp.]|uniref:Rha family transcriptional regulator n=1 Tax=Malikia sp. TaxID=2070706 RepID=UPI00262272EB|nr:Rha family transcriptional regulator [Malikia sp.]MDD2728341.1 Rha family transcriptional regulator [Malikia sp.]